MFQLNESLADKVALAICRYCRLQTVALVIWVILY